MNGSFRQSMAWLHTWAGLTAGWVLLMMFLAGTAAVFKEEINTWMTPELGGMGDPMRAVELAEARLEHVAPDASSWRISLPTERNPATRISWEPRQNDAGSVPRVQSEVLDSVSGQTIEPRQTRGGDLFYRLHYRFEIANPVRRGWWLSGAATMFMLVAIVTGVLTHKRIFKDLFTFRPRASKQRSWLDAHTLLAVLLLPFHLMIAYTGLVPIMTTIMPWGAIANYGDERPLLDQFLNMEPVRNAYSRDRRPESQQIGPAEVAVPTAPLRPIAERARDHFGASIDTITVRNPNDLNAVIEIVRRPGGELSNRSQRMLFDGVSRAAMPASNEPGRVAKLQAAMYGMHMGRFAEPLLRWAYFLAGLASTAMIATGLIVWVTKRRRRFSDAAVPFGQRLVERLNVAAIAGLPIAMAAYFWANRLLPLGIAERAQAEVRVFFLVWLLTFVFAVLRPSKRAWIEELYFAAFAFGALPVVNALTTDRGLVTAVMHDDWLMAGFDLTMAAAGGLFAFAAWKVDGIGKAAADPVPSRRSADTYAEWPK